MVRLSRLALAEKATVVRVKRPSRFMEMELLEGSRKAASRLPQYLMNAMLGEAWAVAVPRRDDIVIMR
jgi:hypothetical protein